MGADPSQPCAPSPSPACVNAPPRRSRCRRSSASGSTCPTAPGRRPGSRGSTATASILRVGLIDPCATVLAWCEEGEADHAIVGGFYLRPGGPPLGHLRIDGARSGERTVRRALGRAPRLRPQRRRPGRARRPAGPPRRRRRRPAAGRADARRRRRILIARRRRPRGLLRRRASVRLRHHRRPLPARRPRDLGRAT